jgi:hypothetical protein
VVLGAASPLRAIPITSTADPALAGATIIDFDGVVAGDYNPLVLPGVTFSGASSLTICAGCGGGGGGYGDVGMSLHNEFGTPATIVVTFDNTVSAFGIQYGAVNSPWDYVAFDESDSVIETLNLSDSCCGPFFNGIAAPGIKRVELRASTGDWAVFDFFHFVEEVPEPATALLLISGLLGLAAHGWRRLH